MLTEELKERTRQAHVELEKKLITRIKRIATVTDYAELLEIMYGFYEPVQRAITPFLPADRKRGRQSQNILRDLIDIGSPMSSSPQLCDVLPCVDGTPDAIGVLYVLEGSTLGGTIIASMIGKQLNIPVDNGFSFFNAYGERTKSMWEEFRSWLNENRDDQEKERIITAATETFVTFKTWLRQYESATHE